MQKVSTTLRSIFCRTRSKLTNVWIQATLAFTLFAGGGLALFYFRILPNITPGSGYTTEFAWDQLVASGLAVVLAIIFGRYAVESVNQFRESRREERQAEERNLFLSLFYELNGNRLNLLVLDGRIVMPHAFRMRTRPGVQRTVFDALIAGPLWRSRRFADVLPAVEQAYGETQRLYISLQPHPPWVALVIAGELMVAWTAKTWGQRTPRDYAAAGVVAMGGHLIMSIWQEEDARRAGRVKSALVAVEAAMARISEGIFGVPVAWDTLNSQLPQGFRILPEISSPGSSIMSTLQSRWRAFKR